MRFLSGLRRARSALLPVRLRSGLGIREVTLPRYNKPSRYADCLTVLCPTTRAAIPTKVATDVRTLAKSWHSKIKISCPHCGEAHTYRICEAFVEAAISHARLRGEYTAVTNLSPLRPRA
jgi:hypothetical protein